MNENVAKFGITSTSSMWIKVAITYNYLTACVCKHFHIEILRKLTYIFIQITSFTIFIFILCSSEIMLNTYVRIQMIELKTLQFNDYNCYDVSLLNIYVLQQILVKIT